MAELGLTLFDGKPQEAFLDYLAGPSSGAIWYCPTLLLGVAGLVFRVGQLWLEQDLSMGLVWMTKILTDPFHDIWLYHKAPLHLLRGELIDPMQHVRQR